MKLRETIRKQYPTGCVITEQSALLQSTVVELENRNTNSTVMCSEEKPCYGRPVHVPSKYTFTVDAPLKGNRRVDGQEVSVTIKRSMDIKDRPGEVNLIVNGVSQKVEFDPDEMEQTLLVHYEKPKFALQSSGLAPFHRTEHAGVSPTYALTRDECALHPNYVGMEGRQDGRLAVCTVSSIE